MKRIVSILLVTLMIVGLFAACGSSSESPVGEWKIKTMNGKSVKDALNEELAASGMTLDQAAAIPGLDLDHLDEMVTMKFEEGGKMSMNMNIMGMEESEEGTWTLDGSKLTITIDGEAKDFEFTGSEIKAEVDDMSLVMVRK